MTNILQKVNYRLSCWLWKTLSKKPPKRWESYAATVVPWFFAGILFSLSMLICFTAELEILKRITFCTILLFATVCYIWSSIRDDIRREKINRLHEVGLEYWHNINKKYHLE